MAGVLRRSGLSTFSLLNPKKQPSITSFQRFLLITAATSTIPEAAAGSILKPVAGWTSVRINDPGSLTVFAANGVFHFKGDIPLGSGDHQVIRARKLSVYTEKDLVYGGPCPTTPPPDQIVYQGHLRVYGTNDILYNGARVLRCTMPLVPWFTRPFKRVIQKPLALVVYTDMELRSLLKRNKCTPQELRTLLKMKKSKTLPPSRDTKRKFSIGSTIWKAVSTMVLWGTFLGSIFGSSEVSSSKDSDAEITKSSSSNKNTTENSEDEKDTTNNDEDEWF